MLPWEDDNKARKWNDVVDEYLLCGSIGADECQDLDEYQRKFVDELKRSYARLSERLATEVPTRHLLATCGHLEGFWGALRTIIKSNFKRLCN